MFSREQSIVPPFNTTFMYILYIYNYYYSVRLKIETSDKESVTDVYTDEIVTIHTLIIYIKI